MCKGFKNVVFKMMMLNFSVPIFVCSSIPCNELETTKLPFCLDGNYVKETAPSVHNIKNKVMMIRHQDGMM